MKSTATAIWFIYAIVTSISRTRFFLKVLRRNGVRDRIQGWLFGAVDVGLEPLHQIRIGNYHRLATCQW
jgi:hypothetical protein